MERIVDPLRQVECRTTVIGEFLTCFLIRQNRILSEERAESVGNGSGIVKVSVRLFSGPAQSCSIDASIVAMARASSMDVG